MSSDPLLTPLSEHPDEAVEACLGVERSVRGRRWQLRYDPHALEAYQAQSGLSILESALLLGREVCAEDSALFLDPTLKNSLPDPSSLHGMDDAALLILEAMRAGQKITIFADYDVDGGTSAAQLIRWGRGLDYEFDLYVPDRVREGYGPSEAAFTQLKSDGVDLVITVDCGAAAYSALEHAAKIDLPVIVIDHHLMEGDPPPALALVNPNQKDDSSGQGHLAAAGVTFMLLVALARTARAQGLQPKTDLLELLGLTALGTICDVVPLRGVNRSFVRQGLKVLSTEKIIGIKALADISNATPPFTTYHAGFVLGPRLNAGGRIGAADMGARLLSTEDAQLAYAHASELDRVNQERRQMQDQMLEEATEMAQGCVDDPVLIVANEGWHPGIIGIIAGRLKDRFHKPTIVIALNIGDDEGETLAKGSGRSIRGVDLGSAIVAAKNAGLLQSGGGHAMAGGLSLAPENIAPFRDFICEKLAGDVKQALEHDYSHVDFVLNASAVGESLMRSIAKVGPYGAGNSQPVFAFANLTIQSAQIVRGGHIRFSLTQDGGRLSGICFRPEETGLDAVLMGDRSTRVHALGQLRQSEWQSRKRIDFHLLDLAPAT